MNRKEKEEQEDKAYIQEKRQRLIMSRPFDIHHFYPYISELTFPTTSFPISQKQALAMAHFYMQYSLNRKEAFTTEDKESLKQVKDMVEKSIKDLKVIQEGSRWGKMGSFFCRLSSRSPKDAVFFSPLSRNRVEKILYQLLFNQEVKENEKKEIEITLNDYMTFKESGLKAMEITTSEDVLDLLLYSERVYMDLQLELMCTDLFCTNIILRSWCDELKYSMEFRGFVYHGQLTALSQYDDGSYYPHVSQNHDKIEKAIRHYFETKALPYIEKKRRELDPDDQDEEKRKNHFLEKYVMDFGILHLNEEDPLESDVVVIELNPYDRITGASLFHWVNDQEVLEGRKTFEFRYQSDPLFKDSDLSNCIAFENYELIENAKRAILQKRKETETLGKSSSYWSSWLDSIRKVFSFQ